MKKSIVFFLSVIMIMLSCSNNIYAENVKYGANDIVYEQNYVFSDGRLTDVKDENGIVIEHNEYENGMRVYKEGNSICQFVYDSKKNLLYENRNGTQIQYIYDYNEQGKYYLINGFIVDGNKYNYLRNEENKIEGIYDDNDNLLAKYKYNGNTLTQVLKSNNGVWSECNDEEFIGNYNKIRNVFAYYDDETKLYYENGCFYDSITNKSIRELNSEIGIATCSYEDDLDWEVHNWQQELLNDEIFSAACSHTGDDWYEYYSTVEVLARMIYGEQTSVIRDQDAIAWVIRNRAWYRDQALWDVITAPYQFSALYYGSPLCTQAQDIGDPGWCNAVYAACVLCTTLDEYDWEVLNEKPSGMMGQEYYIAGSSYKWLYEYDGDMYDGYGKIHEVWIAGYGYVDSIDELYYIIDDYFDRNIFYDYDRS